MEELTEIIAIVCVIALPIGFGMFLGLTSIRAKHSENMELIKQGIVPPPQTEKKQTPDKYRSLRNGFLLVGLALGLIIAMVVNNVAGFEQNDRFPVMAGCVLLFLGLAYLGFYMLIKDKQDIDSDTK